MKRFVLAALALTLPATAQAQSGPYKLIVVANDSAVTIDYPSLERCQKAATAAEEEARRRLREAYAESPNPIIKPALRVIAFCIPG